MGTMITDNFKSEELVVITPLKGAFIFCSDLIRCIDLPMRIDFIEVSSYGDRTESSGEIKLIKDLTHDITGKHVLLVEDILDSGLTISYAGDLLSKKKPASISVASLLNKNKTDIKLDYCGFDIEDLFVVGYGMDYRGYFRNLDHIAVLDEMSKRELDRNIEENKS